MLRTLECTSCVFCLLPTLNILSNTAGNSISACSNATSACMSMSIPSCPLDRCIYYTFCHDIGLILQLNEDVQDVFSSCYWLMEEKMECRWSHSILFELTPVPPEGFCQPSSNWAGIHKGWTNEGQMNLLYNFTQEIRGLSYKAETGY